jgi:electron-transferring-flavoprotein dehydrogenase
MLAAETVFETLVTGDATENVLRKYADRFEKSWAKTELWKVRNFRQGFQKGIRSGLFHAALQQMTGGRGLKDPMPAAPGHTQMQQLRDFFGETGARVRSMQFDGKLTLGKMDDVYLSDTAHEEDQPCHLKILDPEICVGRCTHEYGNPCQHFCPAQVYEMVQAPAERPRLQINFTNCVHCKTCDIMDPYQIIAWTPPEGGGGPDWKNM